MKKLLLSFFFLLLSTGLISAQIIPDPMMEPVQAVSSAASSAASSKDIVSQSALVVRGVIAVDDAKSQLNVVIVNDKYYKLNTLIDNQWRVISITKKRVVLYDIKTKEKKNFNFAGVQP